MGTDPDLARRLEPPNPITRRLEQSKPMLLDGAMGTELERRGAPCALPLWSARALLDDPGLVSQIHADYVAAGAEILTANTFRAQRRTLAQGGLGTEPGAEPGAVPADRAAELTRVAVRLAREAAENARPVRTIWIAGSAPPLEDCYRPDLVPSERELEREHAEHAENLAAAGVDAILVETMNSTREALAATRAARATGLPVLVSFVCGNDATLLSGEPLLDAAREIAREQPAALLVNCLPVSQVAACLSVLRSTGLPYGVYPNLIGPPSPSWKESAAAEMTVTAFATLASDWMRTGIDLIGGCCGTNPNTIRALPDLCD